MTFILVAAADSLPPARRSKTHQQIYPVLVRILIGTGMRIGEVLALTRGDVDPVNGVIRVINGKNGVSRYIPVSDSLKKIICDYSETIDISDEDKPFFTSSYTGGHLTYDAMKYMFPKMFKAADIYKADGKTPNIHSIRHTFCTRSLEKMLHSGMNIYTAIPLLAAYVGHVNYMDTEKYIHFTEQGHTDFLQKESSLCGCQMLAVALTELSFQVSGITVNIFSPYTKSSIIEPITISKGFYFYLHLAADRLTNPPTGCFLCFSGCKDKSLFSFLQISRVPILHNGTQTKGFVTNCKD